MNKKLLTIFLSLFLVGILSISCSNKDKTAPDTSTPDTTTPKTIDPKYSGIWTSSYNPDAVEIDINGNIYEYQNSSRGTKGEIIEANGPTYKVKIYNDEVTIKFTDENNATVTTKDREAPYTKTSKGIQQINGNSYVSESAIMGSLYLWVSVKDSKVGMSGGNDQTSEPQYQGYFSVTGSGTDYSFSTDYYGQPNAIEGTLKFASDGSTVTVNYSKNPAMSSIEGKNIVCNIKK